MTRQRSVKTRW